MPYKYKELKLIKSKRTKKTFSYANFAVGECLTGTSYYECQCKACGYKGIMSPKDMAEHQQICGQMRSK